MQSDVLKLLRSFLANFVKPEVLQGAGDIMALDFADKQNQVSDMNARQIFHGNNFNHNLAIALLSNGKCVDNILLVLDQLKQIYCYCAGR